jgi:hypothetical protein
MKNVPAGKVSCNAVRDAIVHEIVANIGGCDRVASAVKKKILETKNASRTSQSYLWCHIAPKDAEPYSTPVMAKHPTFM